MTTFESEDVDLAKHCGVGNSQMDCLLHFDLEKKKKMVRMWLPILKSERYATVLECSRAVASLYLRALLISDVGFF